MSESERKRPDYRGKQLLIRAETKAEKERWERLARLERRSIAALVRVALQERYDAAFRAVESEQKVAG